MSPSRRVNCRSGARGEKISEVLVERVVEFLTHIFQLTLLSVHVQVISVLSLSRQAAQMRDLNTPPARSVVSEHYLSAMTTERNINSRIFVQHLLGQRVVCTLSDGRTATGRLLCLDRLCVFIFEAMRMFDVRHYDVVLIIRDILIILLTLSVPGVQF